VEQVNKKEAVEIIDEMKFEFFSISDDIWEHPEVGFDEYYAAEKYCDFLKKEGFDVEKNLSGIDTAFSGTFGSGNPVIGIMGEFDALPGLSQKSGVLKKEAIIENAPGHGCGHNLLGVGSLAAAVAVKGYIEKKGKGTIKFFGCPAEENGSGKSFMVRDGVFDDVDAALSWHPDDIYHVQSGSTLANVKVKYCFYGKASHASISPEAGRSALDAVELMNIGVQFLREHIIQDARIHYAITNAGGDAPGIVQSYSEVLYLIRSPEISSVMEIYERVNNIAKGAALMTDTSVEIEFVKACSNIICNKSLSKLLQKNMEEIGTAKYSEEDFQLAEDVRKTIDRKDNYFLNLIDSVEDEVDAERLMENVDSPIHDEIFPFINIEKISPASTDVGDVSWICPVSQVYVATMPAGTIMHSWQEVAVGKSMLAKKGMIQAAKILAASAIDLIDDENILKSAKEEHKKRTKNKKFVSPIPKEFKPGIYKK